jgi:hypothetical protein
MMPRVTFCQPQVASFGLAEAQAHADAPEVPTIPPLFAELRCGCIWATWFPQQPIERENRLPAA